MTGGILGGRYWAAAVNVGFGATYYLAVAALAATLDY